MKSDITNLWDSRPNPAYPKVETAVLYTPRRDDDWHYSHHPFITHFNGLYYAMWSSGWRNEDDVGQRVMLATSTDFINWSAPRIFVPTEKGRYHDLTRYAEGWNQHQGTLVAYYTQFEHHPDALVDGHRQKADIHHMDTRLFALSSRDGHQWSEPVDTGLCVGPNHGPETLASGRLLMSVSFSYPYTDDPTGLSGWTMSGLYPQEMKDTVVDDSEWIKKMKVVKNWPSVLCEGSWFQTDDGAIHMLLRSNTGRLWVTESLDNAETWSNPIPTGFTNNSSKFHCGRLPDGRWYWVGNPDPKPKHARCPLMLCVSKDGVKFDRHIVLADEAALYAARLPGMHKGGQYGYPHSLIHDGHFHVIVSRVKEAVQVFRMPLSAL